MEERHRSGAFLSLHCTTPTDCPILRLFKAAPLGQDSSAAAKGQCKTTWESVSPHAPVPMYPHGPPGAGGAGTGSRLTPLVGRIMRVPAPKHQGEWVGTAGTLMSFSESLPASAGCPRVLLLQHLPRGGAQRGELCVVSLPPLTDFGISGGKENFSMPFVPIQAQKNG